MLVTPRGQSENPQQLQRGTIWLDAQEIFIREVVLATSLGCYNFADADWVGTLNAYEPGEGGIAASSQFGIISQSTTACYLVHPLRTGARIDFVLVGRA